MAITLATTPAVLPLAATFVSTTQDEAIKRTLLDGGISDTDVINLLTDMDACSNAKMINVNFGGRLASGQKGTASTSSQNLVSAFMQLNFEKVDPVNAAKTVRKSWALPAYADALRGSDNAPDVGTPGTGSLAERLGRIVATLEANLAFLGADGVYDNGGWTYVGGGFGTGNDIIDGI